MCQAGCIPIVINDGWSLAAAPFVTMVDYARFTISVPETMCVKQHSGCNQRTKQSLLKTSLVAMIVKLP